MGWAEEGHKDTLQAGTCGPSLTWAAQMDAAMLPCTWAWFWKEQDAVNSELSWEQRQNQTTECCIFTWFVKWSITVHTWVVWSPPPPRYFDNYACFFLFLIWMKVTFSNISEFRSITRYNVFFSTLPDPFSKPAPLPFPLVNSHVWFSFQKTDDAPLTSSSAGAKGGLTAEQRSWKWKLVPERQGETVKIPKAHWLLALQELSFCCCLVSQLKSPQFQE